MKIECDVINIPEVSDLVPLSDEDYADISVLTMISKYDGQMLALLNISWFNNFAQNKLSPPINNDVLLEDDLIHLKPG
jgi:hypothetical protein